MLETTVHETNGSGHRLSSICHNARSVGATRWVARKTPEKTRNECYYGVIPKRFNNSTMAVMYPLALSSVAHEWRLFCQ